MAAPWDFYLDDAQIPWQVTWITVLCAVSRLFSVCCKTLYCQLCVSSGTSRSEFSVCVPLGKGRISDVESERGTAFSRMTPQSKSPSNPGPAAQLSRHTAPRLATTFGIEFECVLAFHESELRRVLEENAIEAAIQKDLLREEHAALLGNRKQDSFRRSHFPSWALHVPADDLTIDKLGMCSYGRLRPYFIEPLLIAQTALERGRCTTNVVGHSSQRSPIIHSAPQGKLVVLRQKDIDYEQWTLTYDISVPGATSSELYRNLPHLINQRNRREWDSWGIELVSRKFEYAQKNDAFQEVSRYLSTLKGYRSGTCAAFDSVWAGTHVHIGINVQSPKEISQSKTMRVLQHLAYILVSNEDLLTQFHPLHRSGGLSENQACKVLSPTLRLEGETEELQAERTASAATTAHSGYKDLGSNERVLASTAQYDKGAEKLAWSDMRNILFQENLRIQPLVDMLQDTKKGDSTPYRGYFVNWVNLINYRFSDMSNKPVKPTIEFRQHACSMDRNELRHWVDLLSAAMRVAEARAEQMTKFDSEGAVDPDSTFAEREGSKYRINHEWHQSTVEELCGPELLDVDAADIEYWKGRYELYKRDMESPPWT